ncbi:hypothetical protein PspLS_10550 [Pyricularia sp. CBS 133598]|nr:hypothetical protein PspLS_10550 [Pyricularia sp. CBS 133598]
MPRLPHHPVAALLLVGAAFTAAVPCTPRDPFQPIDPQNWVNPDNMTWADYKQIPGTNWSDPSHRGSSRNFNIALVTIDYTDRPFVVTQAVQSTIFGNPQPEVSGLKREDVPRYYKELLNVPTELNRGHTLHEYWMEDSAGKFGVDLTSFGPYQMPRLAYQYGVTNDFNQGACPPDQSCNANIRTDALAAWRAEIGREEADKFELVFILSAGQDESATWQEFGEMRFQSREDVPEEFGPPSNSSLPNWGRTRYVEWTSWASAATLWPNAGSGSSTQGESSGMAVYAHELSHLLDIGDNYNNPYGVPLQRTYTGPWSMMSRGSFNGPGGPHTRWQVPALKGGSQGSLHTIRDKVVLGLASNQSVVQLTREGLADSGIVVATFTARSVAPRPGGLMGLNVTLGAGGDLSPPCSVSSDVFCDGRGYHTYMMEVVDRMGSDSFTPDSGVMISKTKNVGPNGQWPSQPFQWMIDANPQDIEMVDFIRPNGSVAMITLGDYRQLSDALFHAGTRSGSEYEFRDEANRLHFYILDKHRDADGILSYTAAVRSLDGSGGPSTRGVELAEGVVGAAAAGAATEAGLTCFFELSNTGEQKAAGGALHPQQNIEEFLSSDVYRLTAEVEGSGWRVEVPNALAHAKFGEKVWARVAVGASADAADEAVVTLRAVSESAGDVFATAECQVTKV